MVGCKWARMGAAICPPIVSVPKCSQISNCPRGVLCANSFFNMRTYLKTRPRNARSANQRNSYQKWKIWKTGFSVRLELKNSGEILLMKYFMASPSHPCFIVEVREHENNIIIATFLSFLARQLRPGTSHMYTYVQ